MEDQNTSEERSRRRVIVIIIVALLLFGLAAGATYLLLNLLVGGGLAPSPPTATVAPATIAKPTADATEPPSPTPQPSTETPEPTGTAEPTGEPTTQTPVPVTLVATSVPFVPAATSTPAPGPELTSFTATLSPRQGTVYVSRDGGATFVAVSTDTQLNPGDIVRTGVGSVALITYADNTDMMLFENTQVQIGSLQADSSGNLFIRVYQYIGRTFNRVNLSAASSYSVDTPTGVAAVRDPSASFWVEVTYSAHHGLHSAAIQQSIQTECVFQRPYLDFECARALGGDMAVFIDGASGITYVTFTDSEGTKTLPLAPGQRLILRTPLSNIPPVIVEQWTLTVVGGESPITGFCGDNVCDIYRGETTSTCPEDCQ